MTATVTMLDGTVRRLSLPKPAWTGRREISTGIFRTAIYIGPRTRRVVMQTDNIWENRHTHACEGIGYHELPAEAIAVLAGKLPELAARLDATIYHELPAERL